MVPIWVWMQAPAHIGHGSSVTASVQSARFQAPKAWRLTHGDDFGVGKRVAISLTRVVSAPDNLAGRIQHHRTNRYVTSGCGLTGQFQCAAHRLVIFHTNECMPFLISSHDVHNRPQA